MITRRRFMQSGAVAGLTSLEWLLVGCNSPNPSGPDPFEADLLLTPDTAKTAAHMGGVFDPLTQLAQNPGQIYRIGLLNSDQNNSRMDVFELRFGKTQDIDYIHPILRRPDQREAHIILGWKGLSPSLMLANYKGEPLKSADGTPIEVGWDEITPAAKLADLNSFDLVNTGIAVLGMALVIWLGAKIAAVLFSALAFIAFNALIIGLLLYAVGVLPAAVQWVLDRLNWTLDDVKRFFEQSVATLAEIFLSTADIINNRR